MDQEASSREPELTVADVSVVIPLYNEYANVARCYSEIVQSMRQARLDYELILVDDGSTDGTLEAARRAARYDPRARVIEMRRNFGQSAAMAAGFDAARGDYVVCMDGDLQNDPGDIPALLAKLDEPPGYDVVSGWRVDRRDNFLRRFPSRIANWVISRATGVHLHDYGCTLKAYRRVVLQDIQLYGEMHRFIPALAHRVGGRVTEMPVRHRPRTAGASKYGLGRTMKVILDLTTVEFMMGYLTKPLYFFGRLGLVILLSALGMLGLVLAQKLGPGSIDMTGNPLLYLSVALGLVSVQVMLMGLMMEVITRTYHESQGRKPYAIRSVHRGQAKREKASDRPEAGQDAVTSRGTPPGMAG